jgi:spectinomycin phosphotransferase
VFTRPADLADGLLAGHLADGWGLAVDTITYVPVGFGSHHWTVNEGGRRLFVTVDDLDAKAHSVGEPRDATWQRLATALSAARAAADLGLDFVVAPVPAADGRLLRRVEDRYAIAVYPFFGGESYHYGEFQTVEHRDAVLGMLVRLHGVVDPASTGAARDSLDLPHRLDLSTAIDALGQPWGAGPFGEPARELLDRNASAVERLLEHYDRIAARVVSRPERMVLTHGEPHPGNTMLCGERWLIVDWDTTLIAPPERDLWMVAVADAAVLDAYEAATGRHVLRDGLDCYRLWWDLGEIGYYVTLLREPHDDTEDVRHSWAGLQHYLDPTARWPQLV